MSQPEAPLIDLSTPRPASHPSFSNSTSPSSTGLAPPLHPDFTPNITKALSMSFARSQSFIAKTPSHSSSPEKRAHSTSRKALSEDVMFPAHFKENKSPVVGKSVASSPLKKTGEMFLPILASPVKRMALSSKVETEKVVDPAALPVVESSFPFTPSTKHTSTVSSQQKLDSAAAFTVGATPQPSSTLLLLPEADLHTSPLQAQEPRSPLRVKEDATVLVGNLTSPVSKKRTPTTPITPYRYRSLNDSSEDDTQLGSPSATASSSHHIFSKRRNVAHETPNKSSNIDSEASSLGPVFMETTIAQVATPAKLFLDDYKKAKAEVESWEKMEDVQRVLEYNQNTEEQSVTPPKNTDVDQPMSDEQVFDETVAIKPADMVVPTETASFSVQSKTAKTPQTIMKMHDGKVKSTRSVKRTHFFDELEAGSVPLSPGPSSSPGEENKPKTLHSVLVTRPFTSAGVVSRDARKSFGDTSVEDDEESSKGRAEFGSNTTSSNNTVTLKKMWRRDSFTAYSEGCISFHNGDEDDSNQLSSDGRQVQFVMPEDAEIMNIEDSDDETNMSMVFFKVKQQQQRREREEGQDASDYESDNQDVGDGAANSDQEEEQNVEAAVAVVPAAPAAIEEDVSRPQSNESEECDADLALPDAADAAPAQCAVVSMVDSSSQTDALVEAKIEDVEMPDVAEAVAAAEAEKDAVIQGLETQLTTLKAGLEAQAAVARERHELEVRLSSVQRQYEEWLYQDELRKMQGMMCFMELEKRFGIMKPSVFT